jgi:hypothetical protein
MPQEEITPSAGTPDAVSECGDISYAGAGRTFIFGIANSLPFRGVPSWSKNGQVTATSKPPPRTRHRPPPCRLRPRPRPLPTCYPHLPCRPHQHGIIFCNDESVFSVVMPLCSNSPRFSPSPLPTRHPLLLAVLKHGIIFWVDESVFFRGHTTISHHTSTAGRSASLAYELVRKVELNRFSF